MNENSQKKEELSIGVSIICTTYNHEKYIRQCIDGFLMQKTSFPIEIIIHDDASTDNTAKIIKEYEDKYPNIIHAIYEEINQYSQGKFQEFEKKMAEMSKGKYVAICEGDDYWVDPYKLQKQYNALESNLNCKMCVGKALIIRENTMHIMGTFPHDNENYTNGSINLNKAVGNFCFQTGTFFFNGNLYRQYRCDLPLYSRVASVGDYPIFLYFAFLGEIYYINDILSHYRIFTQNSWTYNNSTNRSFRIEQYKHSIDSLIEYNNFSNKKYELYIHDNILAANFNLNNELGNYKENLKKEYRSCFRKARLRTKIKIIFGSIAPNFVRVIDNLIHK